ncbi:hypothetical protein HPB52_001853 [Rhipicephalus sanguineus]|uniref:Uncharacterized protein n=1 Tax=Rhipicephalus sanguineus TaxID=34632 RepID=A0A9D4PLE4_RHISA|nr:hypothetical protein HPB52_001853 [Rhipicephalus sanguineus]
MCRPLRQSRRVGGCAAERRASGTTSGTEKQYGEREQLLQDISDLMREADYVPRTVPRKGNGVEPPKRNGVGARRTAGLSASTKAQKDKAMQIRDSAMSSIPVVVASDDAQTNGE